MLAHAGEVQTGDVRRAGWEGRCCFRRDASKGVQHARRTAPVSAAQNVAAEKQEEYPARGVPQTAGGA